MKKIVSLLIISLWLNSCKNPGEPVSSSVSQKNISEVTIKKEDQRSHISSSALIDSKHKEDLDIKKLKQIIWQELKDLNHLKKHRIMKMGKLSE